MSLYRQVGTTATSGERPTEAYLGLMLRGGASLFALLDQLGMTVDLIH